MSERNETQEILWHVLLDLKRIFDEVGMPFFLIGGTLLGFVREGDILKWDKDLDVGIMEEYLPLLDKAIAKAVARGWEIQENGGYIDNNMTLEFPLKFGNRGRVVAFYKHAYAREHCLHHLDVFVFYRHKDIVWHNASGRWVAIFPRNFVDPSDTIAIKGVTFSVPRFPEKYLGYQYGDWKTPVHSSEYFSQNTVMHFIKDMKDCLYLEKERFNFPESKPKKENYRIFIGSMFCNEAHSIPFYIDSLIKLDYPKELIDVLWLENNSSDGSFELLKMYKRQIKKRFNYHSLTLIKDDGKYSPLVKEENGHYQAGKYCEKTNDLICKVDVHMIHLQNFILEKTTQQHDFILYWFPDAICEPDILKRFIKDMEDYPDAGWFGGVLYRRFPLHRICTCGNFNDPQDNPRRYGLDSPELKFYDWDEVPDFTIAKYLHNHGSDKAVNDMHIFGIPYWTRQAEEEEILNRQKEGKGIFKDVCITAHIFLIRAELATGLTLKNSPFKPIFRWRSYRGECGIAAERDLHTLGYEMYCDSYAFFKHISSNGKIYRDHFGPEKSEVEENMTDEEKFLVHQSKFEMEPVSKHPAYIPDAFQQPAHPQPEPKKPPVPKKNPPATERKEVVPEDYSGAPHP